MWRQVVEQVGDGVVDGLCLDEMIVVEDEDQLLVEGVELVDEVACHHRRGRQLGGRQQLHCVRTGTFGRRVDGCQKVPQKGPEVAVALV